MIPKEKQIRMSSFPLRPGDIVVGKVNPEATVPSFGDVVLVGAQNREGVATYFTTADELNNFIGGEHPNLPLTQEDSMWAVILFILSHRQKICDFETVVWHTYELLKKLERAELMIITTPRAAFANLLHIAAH